MLPFAPTAHLRMLPTWPPYPFRHHVREGLSVIRKHRRVLPQEIFELLQAANLQIRSRLTMTDKGRGDDFVKGVQLTRVHGFLEPPNQDLVLRRRNIHCEFFSSSHRLGDFHLQACGFAFGGNFLLILIQIRTDAGRFANAKFQALFESPARDLAVQLLGQRLRVLQIRGVEASVNRLLMLGTAFERSAAFASFRYAKATLPAERS
jgi:hypothetical protein